MIAFLMCFFFCFLISFSYSQTSTAIALYTNSYQYGCAPSQGMIFDIDQMTHPNIVKSQVYLPGSTQQISIFTVAIPTIYKVIISYSTDSSNNGVSVISGPDIYNLVETTYCVTTRHSLTLGTGIFLVNASEANWIIIAACAMSNSVTGAQIEFPDPRLPSQQLPMSSVLIESVS